MKFYGSGTIQSPSTGKIVHDFVDGPFETDDPELIQVAEALGFSKVPPVTPPSVSRHGPAKK